MLKQQVLFPKRNENMHLSLKWNHKSVCTDYFSFGPTTVIGAGWNYCQFQGAKCVFDWEAHHSDRDIFPYNIRSYRPGMGEAIFFGGGRVFPSLRKWSTFEGNIPWSWFLGPIHSGSLEEITKQFCDPNWELRRENPFRSWKLGSLKWIMFSFLSDFWGTL